MAGTENEKSLLGNVKGGKRPGHWGKRGFKPRARPDIAILKFFHGGPSFIPPKATMTQICDDCGDRDRDRDEYNRGQKEDKTWVLICDPCYSRRRRRDRKDRQ